MSITNSSYEDFPGDDRRISPMSQLRVTASPWSWPKSVVPPLVWRKLADQNVRVLLKDLTLGDNPIWRITRGTANQPRGIIQKGKSRIEQHPVTFNSRCPTPWRALRVSLSTNLRRTPLARLHKCCRSHAFATVFCQVSGRGKAT